MSTRPERRHSSRLTVRLPVTLHTGVGAVAGQAYNLSFEGLGVKAGEPLSRGQTIEVHLHLEVDGGGHTLQLPCRVTHTSYIDTEDRYRLGLAFGDLGIREAALLGRFLRTRRDTKNGPNK